jgi:hypothetical protein
MLVMVLPNRCWSWHDVTADTRQGVAIDRRGVVANRQGVAIDCKGVVDH